MRQAGIWLSCVAVVVVLALAQPAPRAADKAGDFDYYVLALTWNASWCALEGDERRSRLCDPRKDIGFTLHGLWPQHETGWPEFCRARVRDPSRSETARQSDIFRSRGLAWHQWKKHGRCSGLEADAYFALAREAWRRIRRPKILRQIDRPLRVKPETVEAAFLEANPGLARDGVTVTCRDRQIYEVRICLARDLSPRRCGRDVIRDCRGTATLLPMR